MTQDPVSLDELSALCDQMVSLSRAGVPLDHGLVDLAHDLPGRLSSNAERVGQQLKSGTGLADVVADAEGPFPPVYKSIVEAGIRSGRLTVALEGFSRLARQLAEVRRLVLSSLVYPIVLLLVLGMISIGVVQRLGPIMRDTLAEIRPRSAPDDWLSSALNQYATWSQWFWILPTFCLALAVLWYISTRLAAPTGRRAEWINWVPGAGRLLRNSRLQAFTEVLSLLVQQQVPLDKSLQLAGSASGDINIERDAFELATQIASGNHTNSPTPVNRRNKKSGIPPLIRWSMLHSKQTGKLETTLDRATETYRRRTLHSADWLRRTLPIFFSVTLGGVVSVVYAAIVLVPWYAIMHSIATMTGVL